MADQPEGLCTKCSATQYCAEHAPDLAEVLAAPGSSPAVVEQLYAIGETIRTLVGQHTAVLADVLTTPKSPAASPGVDPRSAIQRIADRLSLSANPDDWDLAERIAAERQQYTARETELQRARIGDSEIIGRWMCQAEKAQAEVASLTQQIETLRQQVQK